MSRESKAEKEVLDNIDLNSVIEDEVVLDDVVIPKMTDLNWTDYVLSHLDESESIKGNPKVDGLRRVVGILLGPIYESHSKLIQFGPTTIAEHTIVIGWREDGVSLGSGREHLYSRRSFTDIACVNKENTPEKYLIHAPESAASKAEGRVFRKALNIKKLSAEEVYTFDEAKGEAVYNPENQELGDINTDKPIDNTQLTAINIMVKRLKLDLDKVYSYMGLNKEKLTFENGRSVFEKLSGWQKNNELIPQEVKNE